jgi:class 3 adenylate cyclase/CHASE2 domain-containing sensor protein
MGGIGRRDFVAALAIALVAGALLSAPSFDTLRGLSLDVLTALRWRLAGATHDPAASPAVVVALDEETYQTPPFEGTPVVTWTREIARVVGAVIEGGASVVGFDIILPTSIEQSQVAFGEETLGARVRGFDREFLQTLAHNARAGKIVLGQVQHSDHPIVPSPGQRVAVQQQRNIRALNAYNDPDDIVRRLPLWFQAGDERIPSMAVELAARAQGASPQFTSDSLKLAGYRVPADIPNTVTLRFEGGADDIPTFSLADLRACVEKDDKEFFRKHFSGKVVLLGTVLDVEDRKITSKRFATGVEGSRGMRCALAAPKGESKFVRDSISGVYLHATAVNNLIRRDAVRELGRLPSGIIAAAFSLAAALAALLLAPVSATLAFGGTVAVWTAAATAAFTQALALPLLTPVVAGALALVSTVGYRFIVSDKDKRLLRKSFALYLPPAVIEKMMTSHKPPELVGESRTVTIFFSDVAGFSSFSEKLTPNELVALMNEYLSAMTDIIEEQGGFVDKYIGDAIVAVFGAPLDDLQHATHAVQAALNCRARLEELNQTAAAFKGFKLGQRIGLNSGEALVGNIGSRRRFNYTAMGDAVNLASRLEGANKYFGSSIMAAESTVELAGPGLFWRELDAIRVKGRAKPVKIYEPLAVAGQETPEQTAHAKAYAEGLAAWRGRDFAGAMMAFSNTVETDKPAAMFLERAKAYAYKPPGPDWEPVNTLEGK